MKYVYLTVDLEEWYELDYLRDYDLKSSGVEVIPRIIDFLDLLDELEVKATFFVVAEIADKNADIIREIVSRGHAVGCHGLDHKLLYQKSNDQFFEEIKKAKEIIERASRVKIEGFRASCFSMERDKLELLRKAGFIFDSSKIRFEQHPLYRNLDLSGFEPVDDLVYISEGFVEYEIPTLKILKYSIPISGGGYLRLFPYPLIKMLLKMYEKTHTNFLMYVHPFELTDCDLPLPKELGFVTKFRCTVGRKKNLKKIRRLIGYLKGSDAEFRTLSADAAVGTEVTA